jgi:hypothetical protein
MKSKLNKFLSTLEDYNESFFSLGNVKDDYNLILNTLKNQGYWAGINYRFYFDDDFDLIAVENRFFVY